MSNFNFEPTLEAHHRLEIHAIKVHGANNMNRDDVGRPKELQLGGVRRQRLSSQSQKATIRKGDAMKAFRKSLGERYPEHKMIRTSRVAELIAEILHEQNRTKAEDEQWTENAKDAIAKSIANEIAKFEPESAKTQLVATSKAELQKLLNTLEDVCEVKQLTKKEDAEEWVSNAFKSAGKELKSRWVRGDFTPEIALFGRMTTGNDLFAPVNSPLQVMHAYTTHEVPVQKDYWTATDDIHKNFDEMLIKPEDPKEQERVSTRHAGSGMIDVRRFSSGVFYHYFCIDLDLLAENLGKAGYSPGQVPDVGARMVGYFLLAVIGEQPTGHKTGLASPEIAQLVGSGISIGFPLCATAAFEEPVKQDSVGGFIKPSVDKLRNWYEQAKETNKDLMAELAWSGQGEQSHEDLVRSLANRSHAVMQKTIRG